LLLRPTPCTHTYSFPSPVVIPEESIICNVDRQSNFNIAQTIVYPIHVLLSKPVNIISVDHPGHFYRFALGMVSLFCRGGPMGEVNWERCCLLEYLGLRGDIATH